jgi:hypothetical protein
VSAILLPISRSVEPPWRCAPVPEHSVRTSSAATRGALLQSTSSSRTQSVARRSTRYRRSDSQRRTRWRARCAVNADGHGRIRRTGSRGTPARADGLYLQGISSYVAVGSRRGPASSLTLLAEYRRRPDRTSAVPQCFSGVLILRWCRGVASASWRAISPVTGGGIPCPGCAARSSDHLVPGGERNRSTTWRILSMTAWSPSLNEVLAARSMASI